MVTDMKPFAASRFRNHEKIPQGTDSCLPTRKLLVNAMLALFLNFTVISISYAPFI